MAAAAGTAALLRSLATKMARAPPPPPPPRRLSAARGLHTGPGRSSPTPTCGSSPPPSNPEELMKEVLTEWERAKVKFRQIGEPELIRTASNLASVLVFGGTLFYCWIMPEVNASLSRERSKMKDDIIQVIKQEFEIQTKHIEGERCKAKNSEGQSMQTAGCHDKERGGHQASDDLDET